MTRRPRRNNRLWRLALTLLRIGRVHPDAVVIASTVDALPPVDVVRTIRIDDGDLPIIVGLDEDHTSLGAEVLAAGATAIIRRPFTAAVGTGRRPVAHRLNGHVANSFSKQLASVHELVWWHRAEHPYRGMAGRPH